MLLQEGIVLGYHISAQRIQVDPKKIEIIKQLPPPETQTNIQSFLGHVGYYRRFIANFSKIATPLFALLHKDNEFKWIANYEEAFQTIKEKLTTTPVLRGPNCELPFNIHTDASNYAIGAVLGQEEQCKFSYAIYYISKNLVGA